MKHIFKVTAKVWLYPGKAAWHFVSVPTDTTKEIDFFHAKDKRGWGSLPVRVTLEKSVWTTSIFPDKKTLTYLLPLKAAIRNQNNIKAGDTVSFSIRIESATL